MRCLAMPGDAWRCLAMPGAAWRELVSSAVFCPGVVDYASF